MVAIYPGTLFSKNMPNVQRAVLVRNLKDWRWELRGKKVAIVNKKAGTEEVLDKIRFISFLKFGPSCLDKMRIEDIKALRVKIQAIKVVNRERIAKRQRTLFAKAKTVKKLTKSKK